MVVQQMNETDYPQRLNFARTMLTLFEENENIMLLMSDEAHFHLNGAVNKQNCRYWAAENLQEITTNHCTCLLYTSRCV